jgi:long-chain acyl-CoA synthetase
VTRGCAATGWYGVDAGRSGELATIAAQGMLSSWHASQTPDRIAIYSARGDRTFADVDRRANQVARMLRGIGLRPGDAVAVVSGNVPEFAEIYLGCLRSGLRLTPVNWRLTPDEIAFILRDCDARAVFVHAEQLGGLATFQGAPDPVKFAIGATAPGYESYEDALRAVDDASPTDPTHGAMMLYTSGSTGRPKGVIRERPTVHGIYGPGTLVGYRDGDVNLLCGPLYHSSPLLFDLVAPFSSGVPIVMLERFDAESALAAIEKHKVTHTHMVPTMFHRLLALPDDVRSRYDVSSLKCVNHGAAPTPVAVKRAMIDWFGPVLEEYYAATEGGGGFRIGSREWLEKPGSVGRLNPDQGARILDDDGRDCPAYVVGRIFFSNGVGRPTVRYHKAADENARVFASSQFTVGDLGYVDADGYLFLTGRTADRIIIGGSNVYPLEIDAILLEHPDVAVACCVGVPNAEWGEEIKAVVVRRKSARSDAALAEELLAMASARLATHKRPRTVDFVADMPASEAGKLRRDVVRGMYWKDRIRAI